MSSPTEGLTLVLGGTGKTGRRVVERVLFQYSNEVSRGFSVVMA